MTTKTLRALAKEYAEGVLDKESYRKARDAYFKAVLDGIVKVKPIDYRPPVEIQDLDVTQEKTAARLHRLESDQPVIETVDDRNNTPPSRSRPAYQSTASPYLLVSAVLLIIAAIGVSVALLKSSGNTVLPAVTNNPPDESVMAGEKPEPAHKPVSPAETLIENFLRENNWSDKSLQQFKNDWQALTDAEQEQALSSPMRSQLVNAIHQKLIEERALLGLGDSENVVARQHKLVNFASDLEINDPRLKVETE